MQDTGVRRGEEWVQCEECGNAFGCEKDVRVRTHGDLFDESIWAKSKDLANWRVCGVGESICETQKGKDEKMEECKHFLETRQEVLVKRSTRL